jgi:hypothetical protein
VSSTYRRVPDARPARTWGKRGGGLVAGRWSGVGQTMTQWTGLGAGREACTSAPRLDADRAAPGSIGPSRIIGFGERGHGAGG